MSNEVRVRIVGDDSGIQSTLKGIAASEGLRNLREGLSGLKTAFEAPVKSASNLGESVNAVNVMFGKSADKILDWGKTAAQNAGLARSEFNQMAAALAASLENTGKPMDDVADMTIEVTKRAADMASVFNTDVNEALIALRAGLNGEQEPLRRFGVNLNAAAVEQKALAMTGKETVASLTDQEKALARYELIMEATNKTAGDFTNTSDSWANSQRILAAEMENAQAVMAGKLLPVLNAGLQVFMALPPEVQVLSGAFVEMAPALGQVAVGLANLGPAAGAVAKALPGITKAALGMAPALGAAGVAIAGVVLANEALEGGAPEWAAALDHIVDPADRLAYALEQVEGRTNDLSFAEVQLIKSLYEESEAARTAAEFTDGLAESTDNATVKAGSLAAVYSNLAGTMSSAVGFGLEWANMLGIIGAEQTAFNEKLTEQAAKMLLAAGASGEYVNNLLGLEGSLTPIISTMDEYNEMLRQNQIEALEAQGVTRELAEAIVDQDKAAGETIKTMGEYEASLRESRIEALTAKGVARDLAEAIVDQEDALKGSTRALRENTDGWSRWRYEMIANMGILPAVADEIIRLARDGHGGLNRELLISIGLTGEMADRLIALRNNAAEGNRAVEQLRNAVNGYADAANNAAAATSNWANVQVPSYQIPTGPPGTGGGGGTGGDTSNPWTPPPSPEPEPSPWQPSQPLPSQPIGSRPIGGDDRFAAMHSGGVVPGSRGTERLMLMEAGETVIPAGQRMGGGSLTINVYVAGSVIEGERTIVQAVRNAIDRGGFSGVLAGV